MRMRGRRRVWVVSFVVLLLAGCGASPSPGSGPATPGGSLPATGTGTLGSGLVRRSDGSVEATGYVAFSQLEGGFWALEDRPAGPADAVRPRTLAVLLPGAVAESGISALSGARVRVAGRLKPGVSTRQAGPEIRVDAISGLTTDTPR